MSTAQWISEFSVTLARELSHLSDYGVSQLGRKFCRLSAKHCRLQEAQCNGDWPADNGVRPTATCPRCEMAWAVGQVKSKGCPDCRCEDQIRTLAEAHGLTAVFQGDPRGCTFKLERGDRRMNVPQ